MNGHPLPNVPLPAGAHVDPGADWFQWSSDGRTRIVTRKRVIGGSEIVASAVQHRDGTLTEVCVSVTTDPNDELGSSEARELAAALHEAADDLDGWTR
ncbi:hypothetical protein ABVK33_10080 [Mycobacterium kansasii]|uniref:hypothetical protein n=1 Tax=Mycobacterium kansasii TaxID=1768 RepID=UPI000F0183FF|nr:hypothetical protein [Mycobacterium kansasii]VAZ65324.1 hypothetical protein LAUMK40_01449 [Mycobacterium kansasii]